MKYADDRVGDGRGAEQNETADDHTRGAAEIGAAGEHQETDGCHGDNGDGHCDGVDQRSLQPRDG